MRTAATEPNATHLSTDPIREQIIEADTPVENISLCQAKQVLKVEWSQNIHIVYVERFLKIFVDLFKKNTFDIFVGNRRDRVSVVGMVRSVLHETIHDVIAFWTKSAIVNRRNSEIHKRSLTNAMTFGLIVCVHQKIHRVGVHMDRSFEELLSRKRVICKGLEFWQFFQCHIDLCSSTIVFDVLELIEHIFRKVLFSIFDQIEKSHLISAITQNGLRFDDLPICQTNPNGTVSAIVQNLINFRIDPYLRTKIDSILCQNFRQPAIAALHIPPFSLFPLLQLAHHVMQQHICGGRMRDRQIFANDAIGGQSGLQDIALEPIIKHLPHRRRHELTKLEIIEARLVGPLQEVDLIGQRRVAEVVVRQMLQIFIPKIAKSTEVRLILAPHLSILLTELGDLRFSLLRIIVKKQVLSRCLCGSE